MKFRPVGAELFHADGSNETNIRFSQFCERASVLIGQLSYVCVRIVYICINVVITGTRLNYLRAAVFEKTLAKNGCLP